MKIAVIGGTGLIGTRLVARLAADGHDVTSAARSTGVNSYTGEGLAEALEGVETLVDVSNSGYLDERGANDFFYGSTLNLLTYGAAAGVRHHVALSVVGTDRLAGTEGGYFAAKAAQERSSASRAASTHRALDPVLRVPREHRGCRDQPAHRPHSRTPSSNRSPPTTWRPWPSRRWRPADP